ncbi:hypothetical protein BJX65DRAFT_272990 [Aspergillus insuetus]
MSYGGLQLGGLVVTVFSAAADSRGQWGRKRRFAVIRLLDSCIARFQKCLMSEVERLNVGQVQVAVHLSPIPGVCD